MKIEFYTDGACNGEKSGGWALYSPTLNVQICGTEKDTTNNRMELTAILRTIQFVIQLNLNISTFEIYTDSAWCIGAITQNWKLKANLDLIAEIKQLIQEYNLNIIFNKVKGHNHIPENEIVDHLAVTMSNL